MTSSKSWYIERSYQGFLVHPNVQFSSITQSCPTLCDPMNHSTPGLPVHHHLPEFTQTHVHRVSDAIQPSHPLSSPSPPAPNPSQHQSLLGFISVIHRISSGRGISQDSRRNCIQSSMVSAGDCFQEPLVDTKIRGYLNPVPKTGVV